MIISAGTIFSSLQSDRLTKLLGKCMKKYGYKLQFISFFTLLYYNKNIPIFMN